MKKNSILKMALCVATVLTALCFTGCAKEENEEKEQTYYVEIGKISKSNYDTAVSLYSNITSPTYAQIKEARATLRSYYQYDFASQTGYKKNEIYNFFITHGFTPSEANSAINNLDSRGNSLGTYQDAYSSERIYWAYAEKE